MKHLGDITKIHGDQIEPVDCITFGSTCQDLSIAGRRAGLQGERSGLFMEAVRIIKEMRGGTDGRYPTFAIWENVPGAFSSNKESEKCSTLKSKAENIGNGSECLIAEKAIHWIVRRLTPVECERLQGYPDGWTDIGDWVDSKGKKHKLTDTPRYKALGNSIALPQWWWIVNRLRPYMREDPTLGSLFDGIGGFPLVWETAYGKGAARWASEIEEFPIAVTKKRFKLHN